jgi:hypothetical protein
MNPDELIVEARARIIWGEASSSVRDFLIASGMSAIDADTKIKELIAERNREIRKAGIKSIYIGVASACGAGIWLYIGLRHPSTLFPHHAGYAIASGVLLGLFGIWKLVNGLIDLVRPQSEDRSITDISE